MLCTRVPVTLCWVVHGFSCAEEAGAVEAYGGGARRVPAARPVACMAYVLIVLQELAAAAYRSCTAALLP